MRIETISSKTDSRGREISIIEKYDETAVCQGVFVVVDGEEVEFADMPTATTFYNDIK